MKITFFSFLMSLIWFNIYIIIINIFRKRDNFITTFSGLPLAFFLTLSIFRLIFNFEIPASRIIESKRVFVRFYNFIRTPLDLKFLNVKIFQGVILVWALGALILLIKTLIEYIGFKRRLKELYKSRNKENEEVFERILINKKMDKKIRVIQHNKISSPFIIGILKGEIYIPNISFSGKELEYILSHEINHFVERDSLKKILIQSIKYIFWWNPFSHLFANNFNHILEIQCDLKTTANFSSEEKIKYLRTITKIIDNTTNDNIEYAHIPYLVNIDDMVSLKQRFRIVLNYEKKRNWFKIFNFILCTLALLLYIFSYFIIIQPYYEPSNDDMEYYEIFTNEDESSSFILEKSDGSYDIFINGILKYNIKDLNELNEDLSGLPIYEEGKGEE